MLIINRQVGAGEEGDEREALCPLQGRRCPLVRTVGLCRCTDAVGCVITWAGRSADDSRGVWIEIEI